MKLSIWQQFSSNHSGDYHIVGEFNSVDQAIETAATLRRLLREIDTWNGEHSNEWKLRVPNPVEQRIASEYGFDWKESLDWLFPQTRNYYVEWARQEPEEHVEQWERLVIVNAFIGETWETGHQFANLFRALRAKAYSDVSIGYESETNAEVYSNLVFHLTITSPDSAVHDRIHKEVEYQSTHRKLEGHYPYAIPWIHLSDGYASLAHRMPLDTFSEVEAAFLQGEMAFDRYCEAHPGVCAKLHDDLGESSLKKDAMICSEAYRVVRDLRRGALLFMQYGDIPRIAWNEHEIMIAFSHFFWKTSAVFAFVQWVKSLGAAITYRLEEIWHRP